MKVFFYIVLVLLVFLAVSSGITKILLMPQDVEFFGQYGFSNPILISYGIAQVIGGILLATPRTRGLGAATIACTFIISAVILFLAGNIAVAVVTLIFTALLGLIARLNAALTQSEKTAHK